MRLRSTDMDEMNYYLQINNAALSLILGCCYSHIYVPTTVSLLYLLMYAFWSLTLFLLFHIRSLEWANIAGRKTTRPVAPLSAAQERIFTLWNFFFLILMLGWILHHRIWSQPSLFPYFEYQHVLCNKISRVEMNHKTREYFFSRHRKRRSIAGHLPTAD